MPTPRRSPYPPLELDFDEISSFGRRAQPDARPPSDARKTMAPVFDADANAKDAPESEAPGSDVRPASDLAKTVPPQLADEEKSEVRLLARDPRLEELADLLADKDYRSALVVAEGILADDPNDLDAKEASLRCRAELESVYAERLGSLLQVPSVAVSMKEMTSLALDNRSAFILSLVDGVSTLDMILDMSGMQRLEALRVLHELIQHGTLKLP
jgi:hypothetical protein